MQLSVSRIFLPFSLLKGLQFLGVFNKEKAIEIFFSLIGVDASDVY